MSLPRGGFEEGGRPVRRRMAVLAAAVLALVVGWGYLVVSWGGGEEHVGAGTGGAAERTSSAQDGRRDPQAVPDENAYATTPEENGPARVPSEEAAGAHDHPEGAAREPGSYDPLGTGASSSDLAEIDRERVRFAAARFVSAAYGYSGEDVNAYNQGVGETVVWPAFYDSAGAAEIPRYAEQVGKTGTESGARLTRFEAEKAASASVVGYAYFETGEGYDRRTGELTGERIAYRQEMILARIGETWKVEATGEVEEV